MKISNEDDLEKDIQILASEHKININSSFTLDIPICDCLSTYDESGHKQNEENNIQNSALHTNTDQISSHSPAFETYTNIDLFQINKNQTYNYDSLQSNLNQIDKNQSFNNEKDLTQKIEKHELSNCDLPEVNNFEENKKRIFPYKKVKIRWLIH
jgi:hypothetical protein